jgi:hypothetical protein
MKFFSNVLLFILTGMLLSVALAAPAISEEEIRLLTTDVWGKNYQKILIGDFRVVKDDFRSNEPNIITDSTFRTLKAWERAGLIEIAHDKHFDAYKKGKDFSWDQWNQQTQRGVVNKIRVVPSREGAQYVTTHVNPHYVSAPSGKYTITKIIKNEERRNGIDEYRLVMFTYDAEEPPMRKIYIQSMGLKLNSEKRKAIVLFKFDPFTTKWTQIAIDSANASDEFLTHKTRDALR